MATLLKKTRDTNINETERWISMVAGTGLLAYGLTRRDRAGVVCAAFGTGLVWRGAAGHCAVSQTLGINSAERDYGKGTGSKGGVPYELGIRVDHEVRIEKSSSELFHFWRNFENLPRFMHSLESVQVKDDRLSHWVVRGPLGYLVEWDAEIINEIEDHLIGWRSLPGSQVDNGGSVHFEPVADGVTSVRVALQYNPPAGSVGAAVSRLLGEDPDHMIREDLQRFKELMEAGNVTARSKNKTDPADTRWSGKGRRMWDRDNVSSSSEDSFPASDAPSWTPAAL